MYLTAHLLPSFTSYRRLNAESAQHTFPTSETVLGYLRGLLCHLYQQLHSLGVNITSESIKSHRKTTWIKLNRKRGCGSFFFFFNICFFPPQNSVNQGKLIHGQEKTSLSSPHLMCSTWRQKVMIGHKWLADASVLMCGLLRPCFLHFVTSFSCSFPIVAYVGLCDTQ